MKKFSTNILYYVTFVVMALAITSCKDSKEIKTEKSNGFVGTWIAKDFVDAIIINRGIQTIDNGVTEIIVPENLKDSITFLNEDLERDKYPTTIKNDTLVNHLYETKIQKAIIRNGNLILLPIDERYHPQEYIKADSSLIKKAKDANVSALRILINRVLSNNMYSNESSKNEIKFTENGKVVGLANFKSYYITINGDGANAQDITAITFTSQDGTYKNLGIELLKDKIELYDLVLLTKSDEKPSYKKGKLLYSLMVIKSK